jgi:monofunctional chorismate mutase, high GC gram positive type
MNLNHCREKIDSLDTQILALLNRRAEVAKEIGGIKATVGLPIVDETREAEILSSIARDNPGDLEDAAAVRIFRQILNESRNVQIANAKLVAPNGEPAK